MRFEGDTVAVTGAAGGIGQAICAALADEGASVFVLDRCSSTAVTASGDTAQGTCRCPSRPSASQCALSPESVPAREGPGGVTRPGRT
ncbi:SDR family NAD(P)-dependent oxidoreductase [Nonomuraea sp. NPDC050790]|uniref:SDR family NAD(P)-dependent oxidoreductase n=1 Tax=Nonomuraea sp. NPDC050790 TaxID=3364371 RepID=UPI0037AA6829